MKQRSSISAFALLTLLLFTATPAFAEITVKQGWLRALLPNRPAAGYFELTNQGASDRFLSATSPAFGKVEIHTHIMNNGVMQMRKLSHLDVPAHETLHFKPHGLHLMMFDPARPLHQGDQIEVMLVFEKAGKVPLTLKIRQKQSAEPSEEPSVEPSEEKHPEQDGHNHHNHMGH